MHAHARRCSISVPCEGRRLMGEQQSISQTRQHFTNILLGINVPEEDKLWKEEWEVPVEDRVRTDEDVTASPKGKGSPARKDREKGKERRKRLSEGVI